MSAHVQISKRLVVINSASAIGQRLLNLSVLLWLQQYLTHTIPKPEYAIYGVVQSLLLYVPLLSIVITGGLARFVTESYALGDVRRVTQLVTTSVPVTFGTGLLVFGLGWLFAWHIDDLLTVSPEMVGDARLMFGLLASTAALRIACVPFTVGLQVRQKFVWINVIELGGQVLSMGLLFALLFGVGARALWVVVATVPATVVSIAATVAASRRLMPSLRFVPGEFDRRLLAPLIGFGGWTMVGRTASVTREASGVVILNELPLSRPIDERFGNSGAFRLGSIPETRLFPMMLLPLFTTLPILTAMYATGQRDRLRRTYLRFCRYVLWAFLAAAVPLIVYHRELWRLYLSADALAKFPEAPLVMSLLLVKSVVVFAQPVVAQAANARNRVRPLAIRVFVVELAIVASTAVAVVVYHAGPVGMAATSMVAALILHPIAYWPLGLALVEARWSQWFKQTMIPGLLPAAVTAPLLLGLHAVAVPQSLLSLGLYCAIGLLAYVGVLFGFCLQPYERADLQRVLARVKGVIGLGGA